MLGFMLGVPYETIKITQMRIMEGLDYKRYTIRVQNAE